jgi:predicted  nucleic acid-binding Zn-ribbon protein
MAISKGFIRCPERHCSEVAEVWQAGGKRSTLYTKCPACGTNQGNGVARQKYLEENLKVSSEEVEVVPEKAAVSDTQEKAAIPSENAASSASDDTEEKPVEKAENKPKDLPTAPPVALAGLALFATIITAFFAARKPKGKTA